MKAWKSAICLALSVAAVTIAGCDRRDDHHDERARQQDQQPPQQPEAVQAGATYAPQPDVVIVQEPPPPDVVEVEPVAPGPDFIWIEGGWDWDGVRYEWRAGHFDRPPEHGAVWVRPRYDRDAHRFTRGRWNRPERH